MGLFDFFSVKESSEYTFRIQDVNYEQLDLIERDDYVSLWNPDHREFMNLYRRGTSGGGGILGQVPSKYRKQFFKHIDRGDKLDAHHVGTSSKVVVRVTTQNELKDHEKKAVKELELELDKPIKVRANVVIDIDIDAEVGTKATIGTEVNGSYLKLPVYIEGEVKGEVRGQAIAKKIIKAHRSGYEIEATLLSSEFEHRKNLEIRFYKEPAS